ncbi:MAG: hypothetical protein PHQ49_00685 [Clostridia bacterium]|jgi:ribosomal protein L37AE/L43A|nr:hypothetical protein [Clostridia bacterium]
MPYKTCPNCYQSSYSASPRAIWHCPHCGKELSFMPTTDEPQKYFKQGEKVYPYYLKPLAGGK